VERSELVKGYEYAKGQYVTISKEDLAKITPETAREMQILEFVRLAEVDPIYFETSYYVTPDRAGERAYALLFEALRQSGYVALAQFAMHNREHVVVIRAARTGIVLHTMFYETEIRREDEYRINAGAVNDRELQLALTLVEALAAPFDPSKYRDTYKEKLDELIEAKVAGEETVERPSRSRSRLRISWRPSSGVWRCEEAGGVAVRPRAATDCSENGRASSASDHQVPSSPLAIWRTAVHEQRQRWPGAAVRSGGPNHRSRQNRRSNIEEPSSATALQVSGWARMKSYARSARRNGRSVRARDTRLGRAVAIQGATCAKSADAERRARFVQESRNASALNHPNIAVLHDVGSSDGVECSRWSTFPQTLDELIPARRMNCAQLLRLRTGGCGLAAAHTANIVHRTSRPSNIIVKTDGVPRSWISASQLI
jgi:DNA end-binding protein Ku